MQEIQLLGRPTQPSTPRGREHTSTKRRLLNPARLAAALGVGSLLGSLQPQQMGRGNAENASSNPRVKVAWSMDARWHSVSNAQPARSILQVRSRVYLYERLFVIDLHFVIALSDGIWVACKFKMEATFGSGTARVDCTSSIRQAEI
jgi:hypothetical protein